MAGAQASLRLVADEGLFHLDAPIKRVNMEDALIAYSPILEDEIIPNVARIEEAIPTIAFGCLASATIASAAMRFLICLKPYRQSTVGYNRSAGHERSRVANQEERNLQPSLPVSPPCPVHAVFPIPLWRLAGRPGYRVSAAKRKSGVSIEPGHKLFTRIPSLAWSNAIVLVMAISAPLDAAYAATFGWLLQSLHRSHIDDCPSTALDHLRNAILGSKNIRPLS